MAIELNFDGLIGPTHHYGGHALGDLASMEHRGEVSHPKQAALEGLAKMKQAMELGATQGVLLPQPRPDVGMLRKLGFTPKTAPLELLSACSSASSMWAANSATVTPSSDSADGKVHITIANLLSRFHRSLEAKETLRTFRRIFRGCVIHPPLPYFGDEGAANHIRFCKEYGGKGVHLFVYGRSAFEKEGGRFPRRQTREASEAIVRLHRLNPSQVVFARQHPEAIDAGVFHNDVISTGNLNVLLYHEKAFEDTPRVLEEVDQKLQKVAGCRLEPFELKIPFEQAISSYVFNSQILTEKHHILAPAEARGIPLPFPVSYTSIHESMRNGGGPACLRLRLVLTPEEFALIDRRYLLTEALYKKLSAWVEEYYPEKLSLEDLHAPWFVKLLLIL